ncbi:cob(I)yrinic acid a,c-diamide adenosyltransferase [Ruminococcus sp. HUN007]|nr:cob(I)yrinic acid a,c-diamide adenosyltransferase [Ruminococcus sp. HUN007]
MIHYYYGDGKGKTSSAVGALIRAAGSGMKCAMVQFFQEWYQQ